MGFSAIIGKSTKCVYKIYSLTLKAYGELSKKGNPQTNIWYELLQRFITVGMLRNVKKSKLNGRNSLTTSIQIKSK